MTTEPKQSVAQASPEIEGIAEIRGRLEKATPEAIAERIEHAENLKEAAKILAAEWATLHTDISLLLSELDRRDARIAELESSLSGERKRCARICEAYMQFADLDSPFARAARRAAESIAQLIRTKEGSDDAATES